jgi:hypothetical protein
MQQLGEGGRGRGGERRGRGRGGGKVVLWAAMAVL